MERLKVALVGSIAATERTGTTECVSRTAPSRSRRLCCAVPKGCCGDCTCPRRLVVKDEDLFVLEIVSLVALTVQSVGGEEEPEVLPSRPQTRRCRRRLGVRLVRADAGRACSMGVHGGRLPLKCLRRRLRRQAVGRGAIVGPTSALSR